MLLDQIEEAVEFAAVGGTHFHIGPILSRAYFLIFQMGLYNDACKDWRAIAVPRQTWALFKEHFTKAHQDLCQQQKVSTGALYGGHLANLAFDAAEDLCAETNSVLNDLVNAAAADRNLINGLNATSRTLMEQLAKALKDIEKLTGIVEKLQIETNKKEKGKRKRKHDGKHYCWSHATTGVAWHMSANCQSRKDGHKEAAILQNHMGGCERNVA